MTLLQRRRPELRMRKEKKLPRGPKVEWNGSQSCSEEYGEDREVPRRAKKTWIIS